MLSEPEFKLLLLRKLLKKISEMLNTSRRSKVILRLLLMLKKLRPKTKLTSLLFTLMMMVSKS
jgi:hypothetical protein